MIIGKINLQIKVKKKSSVSHRESIKEFIVLLGKGDYDEEKICVTAYSIYTVICYASGLQ